jgi:hypothetical protein
LHPAHRLVLTVAKNVVRTAMHARHKTVAPKTHVKTHAASSAPSNAQSAPTLGLRHAQAMTSAPPRSRLFPAKRALAALPRLASLKLSKSLAVKSRSDFQFF